MRINWIFVLTLCFIFFHCKKDTTTEVLNGEIVATYKDYNLNKSDIEKMLSKEVSEKDSIELVNQYIEKWMKEKLLLDEAKKRLGNMEKSEIEEKVKQYEDDLLLNEYTNHLISNLEIDSISESVIQNYYNQNVDNFKLNKDLVQFFHIIGNSTDESEILKYISQSSGVLNGLAEKGAIQFYQTQKDEWNTKEELFSTISNELRNKVIRSGLNKNQTYQAKFNNQIEILKVVNVQKKGTVAPLNYVKTSIKNRLINKRKLILLDKLKNQLYNNAKENEEFQVFQSK